jgi:HSP20 family molecular chaperone IbpA
MTSATTLTTHKATNGAKNGRASTMAKPIRDLMPAVDVFENDDEVLLLADTPGATAESIAVSVEAGQITLEAERAAHGASLRYRRTFQLPSMIDQDGISAELRDGVLHVHLKKSEKAKRRMIAVRSS